MTDKQQRKNSGHTLGHNKIYNSFRSQPNSKLTLWHVFVFFKSSESDDSLTIFSLDPTRLKTKDRCADLWRTIGAIKVTRYSIGALRLAALFVWSACKLHGVITWCYYVFRNQLFRKYLQTIFKLANLRNVYWQALFPSEGVFNSVTFICRHIACISKLQNWILIQMEMELQAYLVQFFLMRWEIKRRKYGKYKEEENLHTRRSCTLSHFSNANFEKFLMTAKASKLHN